MVSLRRQEFIDGDGVKIVPGEEYSDAGRGVYPDGLFRLLTAYHQRYPGSEFMLTENGVADDLDVIRGSYLIEHLLAIKAAMDQGVKVRSRLMQRRCKSKQQRFRFG
jgi:beta-glucosidase/6-phospho-beta-glucosidase/beta-galactosidase